MARTACQGFFRGRGHTVPIGDLTRICFLGKGARSLQKLHVFVCEPSLGCYVWQQGNFIRRPLGPSVVISAKAFKLAWRDGCVLPILFQHSS